MSRRARPRVPALGRAAMSCFRVFIVSLVAEGSVLASDAAGVPQPDGQKRVADLIKSARIKTLGIVSEQSRQSFPIPVIRPDGLHVLFLYYPAQALARQPAKLAPPDFLLSLESSGRFEELRRVAAGELGQSHQPNEMIGVYGSPKGMTSEKYRQKLARLNEVYDVLMPEFGAGRSCVSPEVRASAKEFRDLFGLLSEAPLRPYYDFLGRDFFTWIDQVSEHRAQRAGQGQHLGDPRGLGSVGPRTGIGAPELRTIEDDIGISEERSQVVDEIAEEPSNGRYGISFRHLAAIYWLRMDSPKAADWLALLKRSRSERRPVTFHHVVGWAQITYVELAQP